MPRAVLLGGVDEALWGRWSFAQELAQRAAFPRRYRMHAGVPALGPADMQAPGGEVDVAKRCNRPAWMFKPSPTRYCRGRKWRSAPLAKLPHVMFFGGGVVIKFDDEVIGSK